MRVFGIICEYNPFHRGHKWQIDELRRLAGEEECAVVCAMSGDFVQRGDFAIERAHARAEAAVRGGADLVLELPLPWAISSAEGFASASHIRELLTNGEDASAYLTAESAAIYARECAAGRAPVTMQNAERAVLSRLRAMCEEDFARYDSGNEGLYRRFYDAARTAASVDELLSAVKTKRYAYARLRRMLLAAYLDVTAADVPPEVPYLRVLACNERGRKLLKTIKKTGSAPVLTKSADVRALSEEAQKLFALTARAADQYVLAYPELRAARGSSAWTEGPVIV